MCQRNATVSERFKSLGPSGEKGFRDVVEDGIDGLQPGNALGDRDRDDPLAPEGGHLAEIPRMRKVRRGDSEQRSEEAVAGSRCSASLDVTEDNGARVEAGASLDLGRDRLADPAE